MLSQHSPPFASTSSSSLPPQSSCGLQVEVCRVVFLAHVKGSMGDCKPRGHSKKQCPQESSLARQEHWAAPTLETPPAAPDSSGEPPPPTLLSCARGCNLAHMSLLALHLKGHHSQGRTQLPFSVFKVLSRPTPGYPCREVTTPPDWGVGWEEHCSHAILAHSGVSPKLPQEQMSRFCIPHCYGFPSGTPQPFPPSQRARSPTQLGCSFAQSLRGCYEHQ